MTRKEAIEYNNLLERTMIEAAANYGMDEEIGNYIIDNYVTVIPEDARKGMIFLGENTVSYKPGNIKFDLKKALVAGIEMFISTSNPENVLNYIQLLIVSLIFIEKASKVEIGKIESHIIYVLHSHNSYDQGLDEEYLTDQVIKLYKEKENADLSIKQIRDAIKLLYNMEIIDLKDGKINLIEIVWKKK